MSIPELSRLLREDITRMIYTEPTFQRKGTIENLDFTILYERDGRDFDPATRLTTHKITVIAPNPLIRERTKVALQKLCVCQWKESGDQVIGQLEMGVDRSWFPVEVSMQWFLTMKDRDRHYKVPKQAGCCSIL